MFQSKWAKESAAGCVDDVSRDEMSESCPERTSCVVTPNDAMSFFLSEQESCGCGSKPMVPFWGRCTTHFSLF